MTEKRQSDSPRAAAAAVQYAPGPKAKRTRQRHKARCDLGPLVGRKHLRALIDYLADLRKLYPHPNRILFYDDVVIAYLLAFFNPAIRSLRCIEDASQVPGINRFLSVQAICRSTLSEANALFDPEHLQGLIGHVRDQLPRHAPKDPQLEELLEQIVCFDGSYFRTAADVTWALWHKNQHADTRRDIRLNCMYCLSSGIPEGLSISGDDGSSEGAEAIRLINSRRDPQACHIYLFDSGVVSFPLLKNILSNQDEFLCSLGSKVNFTVLQERELTPEDHASGIISDRTGTLPGSVGHKPPEGIFREIVMAYTDRHGQLRHLRLLTSLLDLKAQVIAELYRHRWQIELFFRWFKVHAQFRHLMSLSRKGVTTGFYIAILAAMLLCISSQQPLDKYALNLFGLVAQGQAQAADVLPILARRARAKELERKRLARLKAQKFGR